MRPKLRSISASPLLRFSASILAVFRIGNEYCNAYSSKSSECVALKFWLPLVNIIDYTHAELQALSVSVERFTITSSRIFLRL